MRDEEFAKAARGKRQYLRKLAEKVESGDSLTDSERGWIVYALDVAVDAIKDKRPSPNHRPRTVPDAGLMAFAIKVNIEGKSKTQAIKEVAEFYDVSNEAVRQLVNKYGDKAMRFIPPKKG